MKEKIEVLPITLVLSNTATQIDKIRALTVDIEKILFSWARDIAPNSKTPAALHQLDALVQSTEEIARFVFHLSKNVDSAATIDISSSLECVRLESLRCALAGVTFNNGLTSNSGSNDDVEFF